MTALNLALFRAHHEFEFLGGRLNETHTSFLPQSYVSFRLPIADGRHQTLPFLAVFLSLDPSTNGCGSALRLESSNFSIPYTCRLLRDPVVSPWRIELYSFLGSGTFRKSGPSGGRHAAKTPIDT